MLAFIISPKAFKMASSVDHKAIVDKLTETGWSVEACGGCGGRKLTATHPLLASMTGKPYIQLCPGQDRFFVWENGYAIHADYIGNLIRYIESKYPQTLTS
jgi:hypothetical protein